jgi:TQXA domain-containing protein
MASRSNLARVGAAILGVSAVLLLVAGPATAATPKATPVTTVRVDGQQDKDWGSVDLVGHPGAPTALLALRPDGGGGDFFAYCVQIGITEGHTGTAMRQAPWTDYPDPNSSFNSDSGKVNWILHNSFPSLSLSQLNTTANTSSLTAAEAVAGTQAAIWHFSDNTDLDTGSAHNDAHVKAVYQYLVHTATELPQPPTDPTLGITPPASTTGDTGTDIGPFVVNTNLQLANLTSNSPTGATVEVLDPAGHPLRTDRIVNGTKVIFHVARGIPAGSGTFTVSGDVQLGQMFVGDDVAPAPTDHGAARQSPRTAAIQTLILAQSSSLTAQAGAKWITPTVATTTTTPPTTTTASQVAPVTTTTPPAVGAAGNGSLPFTGVNVLAPVVLSAVLIAAGGGFLLLQRRRKRA